MKKLKCRHEVICGLFSGENEDGSEPVEKNCKNCLKDFIGGGGQCKFCTTAVDYCSKKCQVLGFNMFELIEAATAFLMFID